MSGKKLRQRAFAWFMAIAMVLTNITISPLSALTARAADEPSITATVSKNMLAGPPYSEDQKLYAPYGTIQMVLKLTDGEVTSIKSESLSVKWTVKAQASGESEFTADDTFATPESSPSATYNSLTSGDGVVYTFKQKDSTGKVKVGTKYQFTPVLTHNGTELSGTPVEITAEALANAQDISRVHISNFEVGKKLSDVVLAPITDNAELWNLNDGITWKSSTGATLGGDTVIANAETYTATFKMVRSGSNTFSTAMDAETGDAPNKVQNHIGFYTEADGSDGKIADSIKTYEASDANRTLLRTVTVKLTTDHKEVKSVGLVIGEVEEGKAKPTNATINAKLAADAGYQVKSIVWKGDTADTDGTSTTFKANQTYTATMVLEPTGASKFNELSTADDDLLKKDGEGKYKNIVLAARDKAEGERALTKAYEVSDDPAPSFTDVTGKQKTLTITFTAETAKESLASADVKLTGLKDQVNNAATRLTYKNSADVAKFTVEDLAWKKVDAAKVIENEDGTVTLKTPENADATLVGGTSYWVLMTVNPVDTAKIATQKTAVKLYLDDATEGLDAKYVTSSDNQFAVKVTCPTDDITSAIIRVAEDNAKVGATFNSPDAIGSSTSVSPMKNYTEDTADARFTIVSSSYKFSPVVEQAAPNASTLLPGAEYMMELVLEEVPGSKFADAFKQDGKLVLQLGEDTTGADAVEAPKFPATYVQDTADGKTQWIITGITPVDLRSIAAGATIDVSGFDIKVDGDNEDKEVSVTLTGDETTYGDETISWSVVDKDGNKAPGITITPKKGEPLKAVVSFGQGLVETTATGAEAGYKIVAEFGTSVGKNAKSSDYFTINAADPVAEIKTEGDQHVITMPASAEEKAAELTLSLDPASIKNAEVASNATVTWTIATAGTAVGSITGTTINSSITVTPVGSVGATSWNAVIKVPYKADNPGNYVAKATVAGKADKTVTALYLFDVVASDKKPKVTNIEIVDVTGSDFGAYNEESSTLYLRKDKTATITMEATTFADAADVTYAWAKDSSDTTNKIELGKKVNEASVTVTGKAITVSAVDVTADAYTNATGEATKKPVHVNVVDYKIAYDTASTPVAIDRTYSGWNVTADAGTDTRSIILGLYNGTPAGGSHEARDVDWEIPTYIKDIADVEELTSSDAGKYKITLKRNVKPTRNITVRATLNGVTTEVIIQAVYDWKEVKDVEIGQGSTPTKVDKDADGSTNIYIAADTAKSTGIELKATGVYKLGAGTVASTAANAAGMNYKWTDVDEKKDKDGNALVIIASPTVTAATSTTNVKFNAPGVYNLKVFAQNQDNKERADDTSAVEPAKRGAERIVTVHVVNYVMVYDAKPVTDETVEVVKDASGTTTVNLSVMDFDGDETLTAIEGTVKWTLPEVTTDAQKTIYSIDEKTGVLTVNANVEAAQSMGEFSVKVRAEANAFAPIEKTVKVIASENYVTSITIDDITDPAITNKEPYILGITSGEDVRGEIKVSGTVNSNATNKSVGWKVVDSKSTGEVKDMPEVTGIQIVPGHALYDYIVKIQGAAKGEYHIYAYSDNGAPATTGGAKTRVYSTSKLSVKVVDYQLYFKNEKSKETDEDKKFEPVEKNADGVFEYTIATGSSATFGLRNIEPVKPSTPEDAPAVDTPVKVEIQSITPVNDSDKEGGKDWRSYVSVNNTAKTVTILKNSVEPIPMIATAADGQKVYFNIRTTAENISLSLKAYQGGESSVLSGNAPISGTSGEVDLNKADALITLVGNIKPADETTVLQADSKLVELSYMVGGVELSDEEVKQIATITETSKGNPAGNGRDGYNNIFVVEMKEPVDLTVTMSAKGNPDVEPASFVISGSKFTINTVGEDGSYVEVPAAGYDMDAIGSDAPVFFLLNAKKEVTRTEEGLVISAKADSKALTAEWTADSADITVTGGAVQLVKKSEKARTITVTATYNNLPVTAKLNVAAYVFVTAINTDADKNILNVNYGVNTKVKATAAGNPTEPAIDYELVGSAAEYIKVVSVAADDFGGLTVEFRGIKATDDAKIRFYSENGKDGVVETVVTIKIADLVPVYSADGGETWIPMDQNGIDFSKADNDLGIRLGTLNNATGAVTPANSSWTVDPAGAATIGADGKLTIINDENMTINGKVGETDVEIKVNAADAAAAIGEGALILYNGNDAVRTIGGKYYIDVTEIGSGYRVTGASAYTSSDTSIAKISKDGVLTFTKATGSTVINAGSANAITIVVTDSEPDANGNIRASLAPNKLTINIYRELDFANDKYDPAAALYLNYDYKAGERMDVGNIDTENVTLIDKKGVVYPVDAYVEDNTSLNDGQAVIYFAQKGAAELKGGEYTVRVPFFNGKAVAATVKLSVKKNMPALVLTQGATVSEYNKYATVTASTKTGDEIEWISTTMNPGDDFDGTMNDMIVLDRTQSQSKSIELFVKYAQYTKVVSKKIGIKKSSVKLSSTNVKVIGGVESQKLADITITDGNNYVILDEAVTSSNENVSAEIVDGNKLSITVTGPVNGDVFFTATSLEEEVKLPKMVFKTIELKNAMTKLAPSSLRMITGVTGSAAVQTVVSINGTGTVAESVLIDGAEADTVEGISFDPMTGILLITDEAAIKDYEISAVVNGQVIKAAKLKLSAVSLDKAAKIKISGSLDAITRGGNAAISITLPGISNAQVSIDDLGLTGELEGLVSVVSSSVKGNTYSFVLALDGDTEITEAQLKNGIQILPSYTVSLNDGETSFAAQATKAATVKLTAKMGKITVVTDPVDKNFSARKDGAKKLIIKGVDANKVGREVVSAQAANASYKGASDLKIVNIGEEGNAQDTPVITYTRKGGTQAKKSYTVPVVVKFAGCAKTFKTNVKVYIAP